VVFPKEVFEMPSRTFFSSERKTYGEYGDTIPII
jgi:hypothetical protein